METVTDFILLGSKITADGDCNHEFKRHLFLGRKFMTNLDSILKKRHYFANKGPYSQAMVFPVVMYKCESWTMKKPEHWRIDALKLWCWKRLLPVPWTARKSNQSILKKINPEYYWKGWCWSWRFSTLATWCEKLTHWKKPWCWERQKAEGDDRGWDGWMASLTQWTWMSLSKLCEIVKDREAWVWAQRVGHNLATE